MGKESLEMQALVDEVGELKNVLQTEQVLSKMQSAIHTNHNNNQINSAHISNLQTEVEYLKENQKRMELSQEKLHDKVDKNTTTLSANTTTTSNIYKIMNSFISSHDKDLKKFSKLAMILLSVFVTICLTVSGFILNYNSKQTDKINCYQDKIIQILEAKNEQEQRPSGKNRDPKTKELNR